MTCSSPDLAAPLLAVAAPPEAMFGSTFSFSGEMGMVSRGTGESDLNLVGAVTGADIAGGGMRIPKVRSGRR